MGRSHRCPACAKGFDANLGRARCTSCWDKAPARDTCRTCDRTGWTACARCEGRGYVADPDDTGPVTIHIRKGRLPPPGQRRPWWRVW